MEFYLQPDQSGYARWAVGRRGMKGRSHTELLVDFEAFSSDARRVGMAFGEFSCDGSGSIGCACAAHVGVSRKLVKRKHMEVGG